MIALLSVLFCSTGQEYIHGFDEHVSIVWKYLRRVPTSVGVIRITSRTKPDSGVTAIPYQFLL